MNIEAYREGKIHGECDYLAGITVQSPSHPDDMEYVKSYQVGYADGFYGRPDKVKEGKI